MRRAAVDEVRHELKVARLGRVQQRRAALRRAPVDGGAVVDEELDAARVVALRRHCQRSHVVDRLIDRAHLRAQTLERGEVARARSRDPLRLNALFGRRGLLLAQVLLRQRLLLEHLELVLRREAPVRVVEELDVHRAGERVRVRGATKEAGRGREAEEWVGRGRRGRDRC